MRLTWVQIQTLHEHKGELDVDSGKVFVRFHGPPVGTELYDGKLLFVDKVEGQTCEQFSVTEFLESIGIATAEKTVQEPLAAETLADVEDEDNETEDTNEG